jgi:hypothetical protein
MNSTMRSERSAPLELLPGISRRYFLGREGLCCALGTNINKLSFYNPYGAMNFMSAVGNCVIANNCTKWRCVFEGLSKGSRRTGNAGKKRKISPRRTL